MNSDSTSVPSSLFPSLFQVQAFSLDGAAIPRAVGFSVVLGETECPLCGVKRSSLAGPASCEIHGGEIWTDAIGVLNWPLFLVSERVIRALERIDATGFDAKPVHITAVQSQTLKRSTPPAYFYLDVTGWIDIDLQAGGLGEIERCLGCFRSLSDRLVEAQRYVPVRDAWDGSDLFRTRNNPNLMVFCTLHVLELARQERWTNFRFEPMDVVQKHAVLWPGIDYLAPTWPPLKWYPDPPHVGKSIDEWIAQYMSESPSEALVAKFALVDLRAAAVPALTRLLDEPAERARKRAANALGLIHRNGTLLPPDLRARIRPLVSDNLAAQLR